MVSKQNFISLVLTMAIVVAGSLALAQEHFLGDGPIVITATTLIADKKTNSAVFEGSVVAKSSDMTMKADKMAVTYGKEGNISVIEAEGNVQLLKGDQVVTSGKAFYLAEEQKIIFTESPRVIEGSNVVTGTEMTYLVEEDRFIVQGSRVLLESGPPEEENSGNR